MTYSPFRHLNSIVWKNRPIQLTFFLTRRCNARCPFCFYVSHGDQKNQDNDELSVAEIQKISENLGTLLWLAFSGGEIFLRLDLVEITRIFYENNRPAIILLPTNGLLTETIYERVEAILNDCPKSTVVVKPASRAVIKRL
jgi:MoaA/NifB/PqqE/SkfB family radical SAM enzyme